MLLHRQDTYKGSAWVPWTQNLYTYVGNNPVNYTDPTGHCPPIGDGDEAAACLAEQGENSIMGSPLDLFGFELEMLAWEHNDPAGYARATSGNLHAWAESDRAEAAALMNAAGEFDLANEGPLFRYFAGEQNLENAKSGELPAKEGGLYLSANRYDTGAAAKDALQLPYSPQYRVEVSERPSDLQIPRSNWGTGSDLEPFCCSIPQWGQGGGSQFITYQKVLVNSGTIAQLSE